MPLAPRLSSVTPLSPGPTTPPYSARVRQRPCDSVGLSNNQIDNQVLPTAVPTKHPIYANKASQDEAFGTNARRQANHLPEEARGAPNYAIYPCNDALTGKTVPKVFSSSQA